MLLENLEPNIVPDKYIFKKKKKDIKSNIIIRLHCIQIYKWTQNIMIYLKYWGNIIVSFH